MSVNVPAGSSRVTVRPGKEKERVVVDEALAEAIRDGAVLEERMGVIKAQLDERKEQIRAFALALDVDTKVVTLTAEDGVAKVTFKDSVAIPDGEALRAYLGERFDDLVTVETKYKPSAKLVDQAADGDGDAKLREFLAVKAQTPSVTLERKYD
jgi:hypothetical protein